MKGLKAMSNLTDPLPAVGTIVLAEPSTILAPVATVVSLAEPVLTIPTGIAMGLETPLIGSTTFSTDVALSPSVTF